MVIRLGHFALSPLLHAGLFRKKATPIGQTQVYRYRHKQYLHFTVMSYINYVRVLQLRRQFQRALQFMFGPSTIIFEKHRTMIFYKGYAFSEVVEYNYFIHSQDLADGPFHFILSYAIATLCTSETDSAIQHTSQFVFVRQGEEEGADREHVGQLHSLPAVVMPSTAGVASACAASSVLSPAPTADHTSKRASAATRFNVSILVPGSLRL